MKNLKFKWLFILAIFLFGSSTLKSQSFDWNTSGNTLIGTGILGNSANFDILFRTDGVNRMQLMETGTTTIDGYSIDYDGHLGLSLTPAFFGTGTGSAIPYSILHLNGTGNNAGGPQQFGYRDCLPAGRQGCNLVLPLPTTPT